MYLRTRQIHDIRQVHDRHPDVACIDSLYVSYWANGLCLLFYDTHKHVAESVPSSMSQDLMSTAAEAEHDKTQKFIISVLPDPPFVT